MSATSQVFYPSGANATFDLDYYLNTHMPLVMKHWGPHGLKAWTINKFSPKTATGTDCPYIIHAYLTWESLDAFHKALPSPGTKAVMDDIPKFTSQTPIHLMADIVGSG